MTTHHLRFSAVITGTAAELTMLRDELAVAPDHALAVTS
jgi:hypothetical protein